MIKKIMLGIVLFIVIAVAVLAVGKNIIVKHAVMAGVKAVTGLKLTIDDMNIGVKDPLVGITGLKLYNPEGFVDPVMVDIPEIYIAYDLGALFTKKVHIREMRLHLKEFTVVKNKDGVLNLDSLKVAQAPAQPAEEKTPEEKKPAGEKPQIAIDLLKLKIENVYYKDYSASEEPEVRQFAVNIDATYENVTDLEALTKIIVVKAIANTAIASLANFDLGPLADGLTGSVKDAGKLFGDVAGKTLSTGTDVGKEAVSAAGDAVKQTTESLKKLIPFGSK